MKSLKEGMENKVYLIGEIGQNHNGSVDLAKKCVDLAATPVEEELFNLSFKGMDAVKLTKRDLRFELSNTAFNEPYKSPQSFGETYGDHRKFLELTDEEHFEIYEYSKSKDLDFIETFCSPNCLSLLKLFLPDKLKIASRDLTNIPLLEAMAETRIHLILSTGMAGERELKEALNAITRYHSEISILHCVSEYPTKPQHVNLNSIPYLKKKFSQYTIGYSDHTIGISAPVAAVAMGARIIEKHITIDRNLKGTDQKGSLGKDGVRRMVRDVRLLELSFGKEDIFIEPAVMSARLKLERSLASNKEIRVGERIKEEDLHLLSPGMGFKWRDKELVIGRKVKRSIGENEIILAEWLEN